MDYLQYQKKEFIQITTDIVLNLVINGLPSILNLMLFEKFSEYKEF